MSVLSIGSGRGAGRKSARSLAGKQWGTSFETSLETMLDPFAIIAPVRDRDGHITDFEYAYANTAMAENVHMDREALIGRRLLDVRPAHEVVRPVRDVLPHPRLGGATGPRRLLL